ncbi:hypothetical protein GJ700_32605 [Duganella sp. FT92W]|uniref:Uncharacterized protein n=1 Tax=Pseudoduganella rivuli TaxID=2666085 RepID=A0A7X2IVW4_9BURK|nr:hypothetical protein [Pseudoduganella rivuli]MRV76463.1 hypothetical protein [Pseudoduganella rivuli]
MKKLSKFIMSTSVAALFSACGGGGYPPTSTTISTSKEPIAIVSTLVNGVDYWQNGSAVAGGKDIIFDNVTCLTSEDYHIHSHLTIIRDQTYLAVPANIGLQGCAYELHTHDKSGVIHVETSKYKKFTLGQFFAVWGKALDSKVIAEFHDVNFLIYLTDGDGPVRYFGNPKDIELLDKREITVIVGIPPSSLPTYIWQSPS